VRPPLMNTREKDLADIRNLMEVYAEVRQSSAAVK
jgi:hypothetical protein